MKKACNNWTVFIIIFIILHLSTWLYEALIYDLIDIGYKANNHIVYSEQEPKLFLTIEIVSITGILYLFYMLIDFIKCKRYNKNEETNNLP